MVPILCTSSLPLYPWALPLGTESGHRNTECDYSSAHVSLYTVSDVVGHGVCSHCFPGEFYAHMPIYLRSAAVTTSSVMSLFLSSCKRYQFWPHRSAWRYAKWWTGSSERQQTIYSRIWASLGIISSPTLNYDGRSHSYCSV